jgi:hypothetical protein
MNLILVFLIAGRVIPAVLDGRMDETSRSLIEAFAANFPSANRVDPFSSCLPGRPIRPKL